MQQRLAHKRWHTNIQPLSNRRTPKDKKMAVRGARENAKKIVTENAVVVMGRRGCCMSHVVTRLLLGLGVNPRVHEVDEDDEVVVMAELERMRSSASGGGGGAMSFPTVFIGGKWFGGLDRVMATHITGELTPFLKQAGALWL